MSARLLNKGPHLKLFGLLLLLALGLVLLIPVQDARSSSFESQYENASQLFFLGYLEKIQNAAERA